MIEDKQLDLSSAINFFTQAVNLAREQGKIECLGKPELTEVDVSSGSSHWVSLYEEQPNLSFKKFIASAGTVFNRESCEGYHKIVIIDYGKCQIVTDDEVVTLPDTRKFFYLMNGVSFEVYFLEDTCFYCVSLPV